MQTLNNRKGKRGEKKKNTRNIPIRACCIDWPPSVACLISNSSSIQSRLTHELLSFAFISALKAEFTLNTAFSFAV